MKLVPVTDLPSILDDALLPIMVRRHKAWPGPILDRYHRKKWVRCILSDIDRPEHLDPGQYRAYHGSNCMVVTVGKCDIRLDLEDWQVRNTLVRWGLEHDDLYRVEQMPETMYESHGGILDDVEERAWIITRHNDGALAVYREEADAKAALPEIRERAWRRLVNRSHALWTRCLCVHQVQAKRAVSETAAS